MKISFVIGSLNTKRKGGGCKKPILLISIIISYVIVFMKALLELSKLTNKNPNVLLVNSNANMSLCITNAVVHSLVNNKMYD